MNKEELIKLIKAIDISYITVETSMNDDEEAWFSVTFSGSPKKD